MRNHETRMVEREISPQEVDIELPGPVTNVANATRRSLESVGEGEEFERISAGPHEERSVQKVRLRGADRGRLKQARDARLRVELGAEHLDRLAQLSKRVADVRTETKNDAGTETSFRHRADC